MYNVDLKLSGTATAVAVTTAPGDSATTVFAMKKQTLTSDAGRSSDTGLFINHFRRTADTTVASNTIAPCTISCSRSARARFVKVEHPFHAYKNDVFLLPFELDEKVPKMHFLALNSAHPGSWKVQHCVCQPLLPTRNVELSVNEMSLKNLNCSVRENAGK